MNMRYLYNVVTLELDEATCVGCGMCISVCPHAVFDMKERKAAIVDRNACMECGACARNCPVNAIKVAAGTGCATGLINSALGRKGDCCCAEESCRPDCSTEEPSKPSCCGDTSKPAEPSCCGEAVKEQKTSCCGDAQESAETNCCGDKPKADSGGCCG